MATFGDDVVTVIDDALAQSDYPTRTEGAQIVADAEAARDAAMAASTTPQVAHYSGTDLVLDVSHAGKYIVLTSADTVTVTVSDDAWAGWIADSEVTFEQQGDGVPTFYWSVPVQVDHAADSMAQIRGKYLPVTLKRKGANRWTLFGGLEQV